MQNPTIENQETSASGTAKAVVCSALVRLPSPADRQFVEEIDTILSCGNAQSSFAYDRVAKMILGRENALRRLIGNAADELDNYIADCENYEAPEEMAALRKLAADCRAEALPNT